MSSNFPIISKLDFSINGSLYYVTVKGQSGLNYLSNKGVEGFIYSYLNYNLKKIRFTANLGYYGPTINIQAKSNSYLYSSIGISKRVLKDKGTLSFRIANPFEKYRSINSRIVTSELSQYIEQKNLFRGFYLSFYLKFGKLKKEIKQNKRSLQIDDGASETGKVN